MSPQIAEAAVAAETVRMAHAAASELATMLPSTVPLVVVQPSTMPSAEVVAVRAGRHARHRGAGYRRRGPGR